MREFFVALPGVLAERLGRDDQGVTAVEYGLIAVLVVPVILAAVALLGQYVNTLFTNFVAAF